MAAIDSGYGRVGDAASDIVLAAEQALRRGAAEDVRRMLDGREEVKALVLRGICELRDGHHGAAVPILERAIALDPSDAVAHAYLGLALVVMAKVTSARRVLDRALELAPQSFVVHLIEAQYSYRLGFYPMAVKQLEATLALGAPDTDSYALATNLLRLARDRARGNFVRETSFAGTWRRLMRWPRGLTRATCAIPFSVGRKSGRESMQ